MQPWLSARRQPGNLLFSRRTFEAIDYKKPLLGSRDPEASQLMLRSCEVDSGGLSSSGRSGQTKPPPPHGRHAVTDIIRHTVSERNVEALDPASLHRLFVIVIIIIVMMNFGSNLTSRPLWRS